VQAFRSPHGAVALVEPAAANMHLLLIHRPGRAVPSRPRPTPHAVIVRSLPGTGWIFPARVPETLAAPFLLATGWRQTAITQVEMEAKV